MKGRKKKIAAFCTLIHSDELRKFKGQRSNGWTNRKLSAILQFALL